MVFVGVKIMNGLLAKSYIVGHVMIVPTTIGMQAHHLNCLRNPALLEDCPII